MEERMYGVILWADKCDSKAVIWCEDHGNLAYYSRGETDCHAAPELDPGDLIEFDLQEERDMRHARNLQRINHGFARDLAENLRRSGGLPASGPAQVITFPGQ